MVLREQVLALVLRLRTLASHDSLTGALNRGAFEQRLDAELARARRSQAPLSLVIFDVDHFKRLNGVAEVHAGANTARAMFADAARALYAAKRAGRDRVMRSDELPAAA